MALSDDLREMVLDRAPASRIRAQAIVEGMTTMQQSGARKVLHGETPLADTAGVLLGEDAYAHAREDDEGSLAA